MSSGSEEPLFTIPNMLSAYRIAAAPFIGWTIFSGKEHAFVLLLVLNFLTDILDGYIARMFNIQTRFGARLDAFADITTYVLALTALFKFRSDFLVQYWFPLSLFVFLYLASLCYTLLKFGKLCGLHLYSFRITGYLQGFFIVILFQYGVLEWLLYLMTLAGCIANIEQLIIIHLLREPVSDVKGLYWFLRKGE